MSWIERLGQRVLDVLTGDSPARRAFQAELVGGWAVELDGHVVARLSNWRVPDQFWHEFDAAIVTDRPDLRDAMLTDAFWDGPNLTIRSAHSGRTIAVGVDDGPIFAFEQGRRLRDEGTVSLRGL
ncbi:hypothetical protein D3C72_682830 [compost metagenome]